MPSLTSQLCGDSLPDVCLSRQDGAIYRSLGHLQTSEKVDTIAMIGLEEVFFNIGSAIKDVKANIKAEFDTLCKIYYS